MPPDFHPEAATDRSETVLDRVLATVPTAVLIGDWGTWVRTRLAKSHDIDIICDAAELGAVELIATDFSASDHLSGGRKWRATVDGIHVDLYVPYQSRLGQRLQLRVEDLVGSHTEVVDGRRLLTIPAHVTSKVAALLDRPDSMPGEKDRHEILRLLDEVTPTGVMDVAVQASALDDAELADALTNDLFGYLGETEGLGKKERKNLYVQKRRWTRDLVR